MSVNRKPIYCPFTAVMFVGINPDDLPNDIEKVRLVIG